MARSFFFYSEQRDLFELETVHINYWMIGYRKSHVEVGLILRASVSTVLSSKSAKFSVFTPFSIEKDSLRSLFTPLLSDKAAKLVFNSEVSLRKPVGKFGDNQPTITEFKSGSKFLLIDCGVTYSERNVFSFDLDLSSIDEEKIANEYGEKQVLIYVRARFKVDENKSPSIIYSDELLHERTIIEFRFNEPRALPVNGGSEIFDNLMAVKGIRIFLIQPTRFNVVLEPETNRVYVRLLESNNDEWKEYLCPVSLGKENYTVYHWFADLSDSQSKKSFDMLIGMEAESQKTIRKLFMSAILAAITFALFNSNQLFTSINLIAEYTSQIMFIIKGLGSLTGAIMVGVLSSALWDLIKESYRTVARRFAK